MKQYMKILKNDGGRFSLGSSVVEVGKRYEINQHPNSSRYEIILPGITERWAVDKEQEGEYYVIVGEHQPISLIGV